MKRLLEQIIAALCQHKHITGYLGDTSSKFQQDLVSRMLDMHDASLRAWMQDNAHNIIQSGISASTYSTVYNLLTPPDKPDKRNYYRITILASSDSDTVASYVRDTLQSLFAYNGSEHVSFDQIEAVATLQ